MLKKFQNDPYCLLKYSLTNAFVCIALLVGLRLLNRDAFTSLSPAWLCAFLIFLAPFFFVIVLGGIGVFLASVLSAHVNPYVALGSIPLAIVWAYVSAQLMHNTAHRNIKPRWLNRLVGEFVGFHQLGGYANFTIVHLIHHMYPDDPIRDPHAPGDKDFLTYVRTTFDALIRCMNSTYQTNWGHRGRRYRITWRATAVVAVCVRYMRTLLLFLLLGPELFATFFAPFYISMTIIYWHFNYSSHRPSPTGPQILDLNHGLYFKVANFLSAGTYFHKTHHEKPYLFNPSAHGAQTHEVRAKINETRPEVSA